MEQAISNTATTVSFVAPLNVVHASLDEPVCDRHGGQIAHFFFAAAAGLFPVGEVDLASFECAAMAGPAPVAFLMSPVLLSAAFLPADPENNFPKKPI